MMNEVKNCLNDSNIGFLEGVRLSEYSYFRTGGICELYIIPSDVDELLGAIRILRKAQAKFRIIGNSSNMLFLDGACYSCVVSCEKLNSWSYDNNSCEIHAEAGLMMPELSRIALRYGLVGFEGLEGIPGTVAGGVVMNAGAYGSNISDRLIYVKYLDENGTVLDVTKEECHFEHRRSMFRDASYVILECRFHGKKGNPVDIWKRMELLHRKRHTYQEFCYPNLGSVFSGSIYRVFGEDDYFLRLLSAIYYFLMYKIKIYKGRSPTDRNWINQVFAKRLGFSEYDDCFSIKNLNTLTNRGQGTERIVEFVEILKKKVKGKVPLENEIVEGF